MSPLMQSRSVASLLLKVAVVLLVSSTIALSAPPADARKAIEMARQKEGAHEALADAIRLLRDGDAIVFVELYFPVDVLREARRGRLGRNFQRVSTPAEVEALIARLERAQKVDPQLNLGSFTATFTLPADAPTATPQTAPDEVVISKAPLDGYRGSLRETLKQAVSDLEQGEVDRFIDRMFPRGELNHQDAAVRRRQLKLRLQHYPVMLESMKQDLSALIASDQSGNVTGKSVEMTLQRRTPDVGAGIRASPGKDWQQKFRFELVGESWRFADQTSELVEQQSRVAKMSPAPMTEFGAADEIVMERFGDRWRFFSF